MSPVKMSIHSHPSPTNACFDTYTQLYLLYVVVVVVVVLDEDDKSVSTSEVAQHDDSKGTTHEQPQQPSSQPEANGSSSSQITGTGILRKPDPPDLADRSSQSSFTSQDGTGKDERVFFTA